MPRLALADRAFLMLETEQRPMNVGALVVVKPPPRASARFADRLLRTMARCPVGPPFNYRLRKAPLTGLLALEVDERIDPTTQVHRHQLPLGSDLQALFERVCDIHERCLDRSRPLWELHLFEGLSGGRVALYFKTHHGLIDGIGFIRIMLDTVSTSPRARTPQAIWRGMRRLPATEPGPAGFVRRLQQSALDAGRATVDLGRLFWRQGLRDLGLGQGLATPFIGTPDVLKTAPSPHRALAHCVLSLPKVRRIARAEGAKVNDVLLATLDLAMTRYIEERGAHPDGPLVADMPVALKDHGGTGNRITILPLPLGRPGGTPAERLRDVLRETIQVKQEVRTLADDALILYSMIQHALASAIEAFGLGRLPMLANAVISNPAGLDHTVYFNGAEVELALPVSVVAHHQVLNVTATTYVDELHVTFIALREAIPDLQRLADYTVDALAGLGREVRPRRGPRGRTARPARGAPAGHTTPH